MVWTDPWKSKWSLGKDQSLRIQICPKEGINPTILFWGWDLYHQSYSRDGSGFLGNGLLEKTKCLFLVNPPSEQPHIPARGSSENHRLNKTAGR